MSYSLLKLVVRSFCLLGAFGLAGLIYAGELTSLEYRILGTRLEVSPAALSVPKGVAGSISVQLKGGGNAGDGAFMEATLRGPAFPARKIIGKVNAPLLLPPIPLVGDYELNDIRLVDAATQ